MVILAGVVVLVLSVSFCVWLDRVRQKAFDEGRMHVLTARKKLVGTSYKVGYQKGFRDGQRSNARDLQISDQEIEG